MLKKTFKLVTLTVVFGFILVMVMHIRPFGKPSYTDMDDYFIQNGQKETGSNNIVTSVVFDYRGMDTLGEASVLFAAALGVALVFLEVKNEKRK